MKAITNYINNSILMFLHYQHLTMLPLPRLPLPCKWQIFHFYLSYSCKWLGTVTFPLLASILTNLGPLWELPVNGRKVGWEGWSALAGSIWVVVEGDKPEPNQAVTGEPTDGQAVGLGDLDSTLSPPFIGWTTLEKLLSISEPQFPHHSKWDDSNPCLPGLCWRASMKLRSTILWSWPRFTFEAPDCWPVCLWLLSACPPLSSGLLGSPQAACTHPHPQLSTAFMKDLELIPT